MRGELSRDGAETSVVTYTVAPAEARSEGSARWFAYQSSPGIMRFMNVSKEGTVKAVSPWLGLQIIPLPINFERMGPSDVTFRFRNEAISPDRCGPGPRAAMARM